MQKDGKHDIAKNRNTGTKKDESLGHQLLKHWWKSWMTFKLISINSRKIKTHCTVAKGNK